MTTAEPSDSDPCQAGQPGGSAAADDDDDEEISWLLAVALIQARRQGDPHPRVAVMGLLAEMTVERGAGTVTRAALGLADVAAALLEICADSLGEAPHVVLGDVLAAMRDG
jgi:hypothetical protein